MAQITLEPQNLERIRPFGTVRRFQPGEVIFSEGDPADHVYFIEAGTVSVFLHEFTNRVEIGQRAAGSFLGEMAVISQGKRTASVSAMTDTTLVVLDKEQFHKLMATDSKVNEMISHVMAQRTEELALKENLLATTGIKGNNLQISIKGDPTMRETVFDRERRESPMDKVLPDLTQKLQTLLIERCVSEVSLHFNSGEIRLTSIFDPFNYEVHPANKLIDTNYLDRHFPVLDFTEKTRLIRRLYDTLATEFDTLALPGHYKESYRHRYRNWQPLTQEEIARVIDKLQTLRTIQNFYLRNMGISITRDAIRMQFNCDGTHIVSTGDYDQFLADNIGI
jgi:CRP-like cAMP-binding protein